MYKPFLRTAFGLPARRNVLLFYRFFLPVVRKYSDHSVTQEKEEIPRFKHTPLQERADYEPIIKTTYDISLQFSNIPQGYENSLIKEYILQSTKSKCFGPDPLYCCHKICGP